MQRSCCGSKVQLRLRAFFLRFATKAAKPSAMQQSCVISFANSCSTLCVTALLQSMTFGSKPYGRSFSTLLRNRTNGPLS